jgi:hypothetical protein
MRVNNLAKAIGFQIVLLTATQAATASCIKPPIADKAISDFKRSPQAMIAPDADTRTIEQTTRDLAASDASLASDLIAVAKVANARSRTAIAAGLAQAAIACSTVDQQAAQTIQQAVAGFDDGQFQASFAAVAGDLSTAATEMAATSAAGSAGSVVITNRNSGASRTTSPGGGGGGAVSTLQLTATGLTIGSTGSSNSLPSTAANSVSPTR